MNLRSDSIMCGQTVALQVTLGLSRKDKYRRYLMLWKPSKLLVIFQFNGCLVLFEHCGKEKDLL